MLPKMDNKGEIDFNTIKMVMVGILVIAVLGIAGMLALSTLSESAETTASGNFANETQTLQNSTYGGTTVTVSNLKDISLSNVILLNATNNATINSNNYTVSGGVITAIGTSTYRNTSVRISASYTYTNTQGTDSISGNFTRGIGLFVNNTSTFFILLSVVVLISIIVIVIVVVSRFSGKEGIL